MQVTINKAQLIIVNVYVLNSAKLRGGLWQDLSQEQFTGEWILVGDLNMVKSQHDRIGPSSILFETELPRWRTLEEKWSLVNAWQIGPWQAEPRFIYHSLQYAQTASQLD